MAKNQPSDAEDVGLIPGQGTKGTCPTREACALQQKISHAENQFSRKFNAVSSAGPRSEKEVWI